MPSKEARQATRAQRGWEKGPAYKAKRPCAVATVDADGAVQVCSQPNWGHAGWHLSASGHAWHPDDHELTAQIDPS